VRTALSVILFALLFWLIFTFTVGTFFFLGGAGDSNPFGDALGLFFLLALVLGGMYGWRRSRRKS
jgi:hypothetical protein